MRLEKGSGADATRPPTLSAPISACISMAACRPSRQSASTRPRKFVARNSAAVTSIAAIAAASCSASSSPASGLPRCKRPRPRHRRRSRAVQPPGAAENSRGGMPRSPPPKPGPQKNRGGRRPRARSEAARAESLLRFSDLVIGSADPDVTNTAGTTTRQMLDRCRRSAGDYFSDQPGPNSPCASESAGLTGPAAPPTRPRAVFRR